MCFVYNYIKRILKRPYRLIKYFFFLEKASQFEINLDGLTLKLLYPDYRNPHIERKLLQIFFSCLLIKALGGHGIHYSLISDQGNMKD